MRDGEAQEEGEVCNPRRLLLLLLHITTTLHWRSTSAPGVWRLTALATHRLTDPLEEQSEAFSREGSGLECHPREEATRVVSGLVFTSAGGHRLVSGCGDSRGA